jgi:rhamnose utilization protein RhaD (predicted bifunctional aldolase and dehydrogenase)/NAD(P)-dependent dehydrogenase (short-subunit alcohol dehydrogenase family)
MRSRWSQDEAAGFVARYAEEWGEDLALRTYTSRLLGVEPALVLHGGGNSSVKSSWETVLGESIPALFVKGSGLDMAVIEPGGHPGLDLAYLRRLRALPALDDATMVDQLRTHLLRADSPTPSIEALVHAFLPAAYIDHTHADAVLALTNRADGEALTREALGDKVIVLPYLTPGFALAQAAAAAVEEQPDAEGMVWSHHGVVTWGETARESYESMIALVSRAERFLERRRNARALPPSRRSVDGVAVGGAAQPAADDVSSRAALIAPLLRGLLTARTGDCDRPYERVILLSLTDDATLAALAAPGARENLVTPPLTTDHLIRTKPVPLWLEGLPFSDGEELRLRVTESVEAYCREYEGYLARHVADMPEGVTPFDPRPRVVLIPGVGAFCAGPDLREAVITRDITAHTLAVKALVAETLSAAVAAPSSAAQSGPAGPDSCPPYQGLPEVDLFKMEYRSLQHAKLALGRAVGSSSVLSSTSPGRSGSLPLRGHVALVTGAAGAIGTGICAGLLQSGCAVAATDLPGERLERLVADLGALHPGMIAGVALDVTDEESVAAAFRRVAELWGGVDLVVPNAGIAAVAPLTDLELQRYRRLEQVNVEGTLLVLAEAGRFFRRQGIGGDIVLVSTKNVFAPGANFGAYSSTKAAAHQLARIASLEFAGDDVRVNMVAPDAVFSHGSCRSGLWAEVGPDRMKARGLDEAGLESYYQSRNLLKARVTAEHVANGVVFFATRQTPTTGATIPIDGGLPDSTPR